MLQEQSKVIEILVLKPFFLWRLLVYVLRDGPQVSVVQPFEVRSKLSDISGPFGNPPNPGEPQMSQVAFKGVNRPSRAFSGAHHLGGEGAFFGKNGARGSEPM